MGKNHFTPRVQTQQDAVKEEITEQNPPQDEQNAESEENPPVQENSQEQEASLQEEKPEAKQPVSEETTEKEVTPASDNEATEQVDQEVTTDSDVVELAISKELAYLNEVEKTGHPVAKRILAAVKNFSSSLRVKAPLSDSEGFRIQKEFLDHLLWLLDRPYEEFAKGWGTLLIFFKEFHGETNTPREYSTLSEYNTARYRYAWNDADRLEAYTNLITVLRCTRNIETRQHDVARIMMEKISLSLVSGSRLENLNRFYKK